MMVENLVLGGGDPLPAQPDAQEEPEPARALVGQEPLNEWGILYDFTFLGSNCCRHSFSFRIIRKTGLVSGEILLFTV
jgi:hypothetical protein